MKTIYTIILCILYSIPMSKADETEQKQILRDKINQQKLILQALKAELLALDKEPKNVFRITIKPKGLQVNKKPISKEELTNKLQVLPKDTQIKIISDASIEYEKLVSLITNLSEKGFYNISFSTFGRQGSTEIPAQKKQ